MAKAIKIVENNHITGVVYGTVKFQKYKTKHHTNVHKHPLKNQKHA